MILKSFKYNGNEADYALKFLNSENNDEGNFLGSRV